MKTSTILFLMIFLYAACTNDNEEGAYGKKDCVDEVSFANDVQPVIQSSCAISSCHTAGNQPPDLTTYQNIKNAANGVKTRTSNRTMPPPGTGIILTAEQVKIIACWVDNGALNN